MAYYTLVTLTVGGHVVGASQRADLGLPGEPRLTVHKVVWTDGNRMPFNYINQPCTFKGTAGGRVHTEHLTISRIRADNTVLLV